MVKSPIPSTNTFSVEPVVPYLPSVVYLTGVVYKLLRQPKGLPSPHSKGSDYQFPRIKKKMVRKRTNLASHWIAISMYISTSIYVLKTCISSVFVNYSVLISSLFIYHCLYFQKSSKRSKRLMLFNLSEIIITTI